MSIPTYRGNNFEVSKVIFCTVFSLIHQTIRVRLCHKYIRIHKSFPCCYFQFYDQYKTCMDTSYRPFDESQVNENMFCWKSGCLIQIDGTKLVLMDIGAHLCVFLGSSTYWSVSRIRSLTELTGRMWSDVICVRNVSTAIKHFNCYIPEVCAD